MQIITVPIEKVRAWKDNPRIIKKKDFERLLEQIRRLGQYKPLIATAENGGYIVVGGNMRLAALQKLGETEVGLSIVEAKDDDTKLLYALSDNDRAGSWDDEALAELTFRAKDTIGDIGIFKVDVAPPLPIDRILDSYGPSIDVSEDYTPLEEKRAIAKPGDVYTLGPHRLICGDATSQNDLDRLLQGKKADLVFTDPPGGIAMKGTKYAPILNDDLTEEGFFSFLEAWVDRIKRNLKAGGAFYICANFQNYPAIIYTMKKKGLVYGTTIAWIKGAPAPSQGDYKPRVEIVIKGKRPAKKVEPILYGWNGGRHYFFEHKSEADFWEVPTRSTATRSHPDQKPLALIQRAIKNSSRPGELVLDPFAGSGSTLIAAEREGRVATLAEIDPVYVDVIIRRYAGLGGPTEDEIRETREPGKPGTAGDLEAQAPSRPTKGAALRARKTKAGSKKGRS